jgi:16S rRNA (guanine966-N2)-methyltransferase
MVRVIAGQFRSRRLKTLEGKMTRPTSDRLKETLFNLLESRIEGSCFLDCFAGSGSVGIEALSRGAGFVVLVESSAAAVKVIRHNMQLLGVESSPQFELLSQSAESAFRKLAERRKKFDIVFLDPPYADSDQYSSTLDQLQELELLNQDATVVAEHSKFFCLPEQVQTLRKFRNVRQGDSVLSLFHLYS